MKYASLRSTADRLIVGSGVSMTLQSATTGAYDPATGASAVTYTSYSCFGVVMGYPEKLVDGTMILRGDSKIVLSPVIDMAPKAGDRIIAQSKTWEVISVDDAAPGDTVLAYTLQVRHAA